MSSRSHVFLPARAQADMAFVGAQADGASCDVIIHRHKYVARPATCTSRTKLLLSLDDIDIVPMTYLHHFRDRCQASYLLASFSLFRAYNR